MTDMVHVIVQSHIIERKHTCIYINKLTLSGHAGSSSKLIYDMLMIIGSHVTVGTPKACGIFGGVP